MLLSAPLALLVARFVIFATAADTRYEFEKKQWDYCDMKYELCMEDCAAYKTLLEKFHCHCSCEDALQWDHSAYCLQLSEGCVPGWRDFTKCEMHVRKLWCA
ncbi:hypothetical protein ACN47E_007201 [Coniothyrium glycines]